MSVPNNAFGSQDNSIHAYAGIYTHVGIDATEYIGTKIQPLTIGQTYTMTITVSLADHSNTATDGLGVLFTTYPLTTSSISAIPITPQIDYSSYGPITDKINWVTLTKSFVADSSYTHIIVGCFKPWSLVTAITVGGGNASNGPISYYYIGQIGDPDTTYFGDSIYAPIDSSKIHVNTDEGADTGIFIFPNAFSPNNDGINEVFRIRGPQGNDYKGYVLRVYNRWGECIFLTRDPNQGWDGTYKNTPQPLDVYFYYAEFGLNKKHHFIKGDVSLIR